MAFQPVAEGSPPAPGWSVQQWTTEDGLPVDEVMAVAVTPDGLVWAATLDGLASLDGTDVDV
jgi:ligand-binding sensor domain-containing protein